jgi:hypothetical protein
MVLEGVIVYIKYIKVGGRKIICGCYMTAPEKVISLSPPHRIGTFYHKSSSLLIILASLITYIMLSRQASNYISITYTLSLSSILTVLLSWSRMFGLMISIAIWLRLPSILLSIFWVGRPM